MRNFYLQIVILGKATLTTSMLFGQITSLDDLKSNKLNEFMSPSGKIYQVWQYRGSCKMGQTGSSTNDIDDNTKACNGADFDGKSRAEAKLSFVEDLVKPVNDYNKFIQTLPSDEEMCGSNPDLRTDDEMHNIKITGIWLYAFKRQNDEDYHLMIGISPHYETALDSGFYNMEISGLPPDPNDPSFDGIKQARDSFELFFGITSCKPVCRQYVDFYLNPIKVEITGSMFYDTDHCHKFAHPDDYPIKTVWEVHPIKSIEFIE